MALFLLSQLVYEEEQLETRRIRHRMRLNFFRRPPTDVEFLKNFRITRTMFESLCEELIPLLPPKRNSRAIDPVLKVLSVLSFYGRGSYQGAVSRDLAAPMSQPTFSRCLRQVNAALCSLHFTGKYMRFPQNQAERNSIKRRFYEKFGLPGVCGCIDCTHIAIIKPADAEERFFNRKHFHSLNVQVICDESCMILNVDARYGGATHDAFIWNNNDLQGHFEGLARSGERAYLLGDSGYPLREYMMTPVDNAAAASPEGHYNARQKKARSTVERTFGILKGRWRCLLSARALHYCPDVAGSIMVACCILHNICVSNNEETFELTEEERHIESDLQPTAIAAVDITDALQRGRLVRQQLILNIN